MASAKPRDLCARRHVTLYGQIALGEVRNKCLVWEGWRSTILTNVVSENLLYLPGKQRGESVAWWREIWACWGRVLLVFPPIRGGIRRLDMFGGPTGTICHPRRPVERRVFLVFKRKDWKLNQYMFKTHSPTSH
jgi:hypothetical protein